MTFSEVPITGTGYTLKVGTEMKWETGNGTGRQLCKVASICQGRRKQSPDGQAQLDVGGEAVNNSRAKRAAKIWTLVFLAVRRRSHCTSASNWDSKAWKFIVILMRAHLGTYPAKFFYSNSRPHKCRTRNYVTSAENGPV